MNGLPAGVTFDNGIYYLNGQRINQEDVDALNQQAQPSGLDVTRQSIAQHGNLAFTPDQEAQFLQTGNASPFVSGDNQYVYTYGEDPSGNALHYLAGAPAPNQDKNDLAHFISGPIGTTLTHFQDTRNAYQQNPERLLGGGGFADTPLGTAGANAVLGTNYAPTINQTGGPTSQTYQNASAAGYNTGPTQFAHTLAPALIGIGAAGAIAGGGSLAGEGTGAAIDGSLAGAGDAATLGGSGVGGGAGGSVSDGFFDDFTGQWVDGSSGGGGASVDPYGTGVDQFGNPTSQYAPSTFSGDTTNSFYDPSTGTTTNLSDLVSKYGAQAGSTLFKQLMSARGLSGVAAAGLGAFAANKQTGALQALNQQYLGFGAPSRARYEASFQPGFTMANDPGYTDALNAASKATLHGLSVQGNPAGSPNAWNQTLSDVNAKFAYPALQNYRNQNANTGGIGQLTAAAPGAATGAIASQGNVYNALGAGVNDIFNPPQTLAQQLAAMKQAGLY